MMLRILLMIPMWMEGYNYYTNFLLNLKQHN